MITLQKKPRIGARLALLIGLSGVLAAAHLGLRPQLPWIADEPEELGACALTPDDLAASPDTATDGRAADSLASLASLDRLPTIPAAEAIALVGREAVTFIDTRTADRFREGHIPGALCLPALDAPRLIAETSLPIDPAGQVLAYCEGDDLASANEVGALLRDRLGCESVRVIRGGWKQWLADNGPSAQELDHG